MYSKKQASFQSRNVIKLVKDLWKDTMTKLKLLNRPLFGLASLLVFGVVIGLLIYTRIDRSLYTRHMVMHTYDVMSTIDKIAQTAINAESGARGFIVTNSDNYLVPLNEAVTDLDKRQGKLYDELNHLRELTHDNAGQQKNIDNLEELLTEKMMYMETIIRIVREKSLKEALEFGKDQKGRILMDRIKTQMHQMQDIENKLLDERVKNDNENAELFIYLTLLILLVMIGTNSAGFMAIQREFARRKKAEDELQENAAFQNTILENSLYVIIACHPDGTIRLFNKSAEKLLDYKTEEVVGKHTPFLFHDAPEVVAHAKDLQQEYNQPIIGIDVFTKKSNIFGAEEREWTYIAKDGSRIPVLLSITALRDGKGAITGYVGIAKDISERKNIDKLKNEFISTVSHELRTPLTSIRGSLGLVVNHMRDQLNDKTANLVQIAYKNTERLTRLINDILDIEKIESGNIVLHKQPVILSDALKQNIEEMKGFADQYHVKMLINDQTREALVTADPDRLQQVLANLTSNAIKFSPPDETIFITTQKVDNAIVITVEDHGPGVPQNFKDKIFGKFAQADSSSSRQNGGTGLGLNICKALVESMDGEIGFDSVAGRTRFYFTLPIVPDLPALADITGAADHETKKILICEDDPDIALLLQMILQEEKFVCKIAQSAEEAKVMLASEKFLAMTLDINLPGQDGISFLRELRADPKFVHLPVVIISAEAEQKKKALKGEAIGVIDWLTKPIDAERLTMLLRTLPHQKEHPTILHLEDDLDVIQMLALSLQDEAEIVPATSLKEARQLLTERSFDLAIVDIKLPDGNGLDILPELSKRSIPIIILSVHETPAEIKDQVTSSMVKSRISEEKIIQTIKSLISGVS